MFQPRTWHLSGTKRDGKAASRSIRHPISTATSFQQRRFQSYVLQATWCTSGQLALRKDDGSKRKGWNSSALIHTYLEQVKAYLKFFNSDRRFSFSSLIPRSSLFICCFYFSSLKECFPNCCSLETKRLSPSSLVENAFPELKKNKLKIINGNRCHKALIPTARVPAWGHATRDSPANDLTSLT